MISVNNDAQKTNAKIRLYKTQVKEATSALQSYDLVTFQEKVNQIDLEIEDVLEGRIRGSTGSSLSRYRDILNDYKYTPTLHKFS